MGILPKIFGGSSNDKPKRKSSGSSSVSKKGGSSKSNLSQIMSADNIDMTASDVKLSAGHTSRNLNVAKSPLLEKMEQGLGKVERERKKITGNLPDGERKRIGRELQSAEDSSANIVKADVAHEEKIIVSAEVLEEASQIIMDRVGKMFELKLSIGDRDEDEIRADMKQLWSEVFSVVEQNMPAYEYIHSNAVNEEQHIKVYAVNSANLFRNNIKAWSMLNKDAGEDIQAYKRWTMQRPNFRSGETIYDKFFS